MFDISTLQYNSQHPSVYAALYTIICSIILGILIAITYEKTSRTFHPSKNFMQAMVLVTIVAATIMLAIGDSIARGLGMLGALSIIRFRTTVRDPRNIIFMFAAIAAGIASGVLGFTTAIMGTAGFCLCAILLRLTTSKVTNIEEGVLRIEFPNSITNKALDSILKKHSVKFRIINMKVYTSEKKKDLLLHEYKLKINAREQATDLLDELNLFPELEVLSLNFKNEEIDII